MPDQNHIVIQGLCQNNLKNISLKIPKEKLVVFTGVSGSGKSSIVFDTIAAESQRQMNETYSAYVRVRLPKYEKPKAEKIENLSPTVIIDQTPPWRQCSVYGRDHQRHVFRPAAALLPDRGTPCGNTLLLFLQQSGGHVSGVFRIGEGDDAGRPSSYKGR